MGVWGRKREKDLKEEIDVRINGHSSDIKGESKRDVAPEESRYERE